MQTPKAEAIWYKGLTVFQSKVYGVVSLNNDSFIFTDEDGKQALRIPVSDIEKAVIDIKTITLTTKSKQDERLTFAITKGKTQKNLGILSMGLLGILLINNAQKRSGTKNWIEAFESRGVTVDNHIRRFNKSVRIAYVIAILVFLVVFLSKH